MPHPTRSCPVHPSSFSRREVWSWSEAPAPREVLALAPEVWKKQREAPPDLWGAQ